MNRPLIIYVDVDDTLVRSVGTKRIPMPGVVARVKALATEGATLYAWSSGGAEYARQSAQELGIAQCFVSFLPKPQVAIDDQAPSEWRRFLHAYPTDAASKTVADFEEELEQRAG